MAKRTLTCSPMRKNTSVRASYDYDIASDSKRKQLVLNEIANDSMSTEDVGNLLTYIISYAMIGPDECNDIIEFASKWATSDDVFDAWQQMRADKDMTLYNSWDEYVDEK